MENPVHAKQTIRKTNKVFTIIHIQRDGQRNKKTRENE